MNVTVTCRYCKKKIDLNKDPFVELHLPLLNFFVYLHFPSCLFDFIKPERAVEKPSAPTSRSS